MPFTPAQTQAADQYIRAYDREMRHHDKHPHLPVAHEETRIKREAFLATTGLPADLNETAAWTVATAATFSIAHTFVPQTLAALRDTCAVKHCGKLRHHANHRRPQVPPPADLSDPDGRTDRERNWGQPGAYVEGG